MIRVALAACVVFACSALSVRGQQQEPTTDGLDWAVITGSTREPVIGLLNIPEIVGGGCGANEPKTIEMYSTPSSRRPPVGRLRYLVEDRQPDGLRCGSVRLVLASTGGALQDVPNDESGYEIKALIVFERSGAWFRVALAKGSAWIRRDDSSDFKTYPDLVQQGLAYLRDGWDGRLWGEPGAGTAAPAPDDWKSHLNQAVGIEVIGVRMLGNRLWLHVRLQTETCEGAIPGVKPVAGWLPAYRPSGATAAWFYARGC